MVTTLTVSGIFCNNTVSLLNAFANWSISDLSETSKVHSMLKVAEVLAKGNKNAEMVPSVSPQGDSKAAYL